MKHRFIHTLWTKPFVERGESDKLEMQVYLYALSLSYLLHLDCEVVLYTDKLGADKLGMLPYTEIHDDLDERIPEDISHVYFACCKAYALMNEPLGTVHIDGDVFIKSRVCLDRIFNHGCDVVVQGTEYFVMDNNVMAFGLLDKVLYKTPLSDGILYPEVHDFNVGVLGFFNEEAKGKYIDNYLKLMSAANKTIPPKTFQVTESYFAAPDLVLEQGQLYWLCKKNNYTVQILLDGASWNIRRIQAIELGYTHLLCNAKYQKIEQVKKRLETTFPDMYNLVKPL